MNQNGTKMNDRRLPGQSQLDYLWSNYGSYFVSDSLEEGSIPSSQLLQEITSNISDNAVNSLKVINGELVGSNIKGEQIFSIDISEFVTGGRSIVSFGKRYIADEDIANGCTYPKDTPVYSLRFSDDSELIAPIDQYQGVETNSIVVSIDNNQVSSSLKINNSNSIVPIKETANGIQADLKISSKVESIQLTKELEGLKAKILLDNAGRTLKFKLLTQSDYDVLDPDTTTIYFIEGQSYFYFGSYLIGDGSTNLDNYYTKTEIDNLQSDLASKQYVDEQLSDIGLGWKSI